MGGENIGQNGAKAKGGLGHHETLLKDPAFEEWIYMRSNLKNHFRWTKYTATVGIVLGLMVPIGTYFLAKKSYKMYMIKPELRPEAKKALEGIDKSKWTVPE